MTNPQRPGQYCACSVSPAQINTVTGSIPLSLSSGGLQQHGSAKVSHERKHGETCLRVKFQALASLTSPPLVSANSLRFNSSSEMRGNVDIQTLTFRASTGQTKCARWNSVVFFFFFFKMCLVKHVVEKCSIVCSCACKGSRFSLCRHGMPIHIQSVTIKIFYHDLLLLHVLGGGTQQIAKFQLVTQQIIKWNQSFVVSSADFHIYEDSFVTKVKGFENECETGFSACLQAVIWPKLLLL